MITTHRFVPGKHGDSCEHKQGSFYCGQPRGLHKRPKKGKIEAQQPKVPELT